MDPRYNYSYIVFANMETVVKSAFDDINPNVEVDIYFNFEL